MRVFKLQTIIIYFETLVRDEAYQDYKLFRAGRVSPAEASYRPLSSYSEAKEPFEPKGQDGHCHAVLPVEDVLAFDEEGRDILERFAPGAFVYWPIQLYENDGRPISANYWVTDAPQVATVEYVNDHRKVWWGDKVGGFTPRSSAFYWSPRKFADGDLFTPILNDWRPHVHTQDTFFPEKVSGPAAEGLWFWKSFLYEREKYFCSGALRDALQTKAPHVSFAECQVVKNRWIAEKQMLPLLEWLEEKEERKREWVRRYPSWVQRHRPDWFALQEETP